MTQIDWLVEHGPAMAESTEQHPSLLVQKGRILKSRCPCFRFRYGHGAAEAPEAHDTIRSEVQRAELEPGRPLKSLHAFELSVRVVWRR